MGGLITNNEKNVKSFFVILNKGFECAIIIYHNNRLIHEIVGGWKRGGGFGFVDYVYIKHHPT